MITQSLADIRWRASPVIISWAVMIVLVLLSILFFPHYVTFASRASLTPLVGVMIVASIGQALVVGTGGIDLSAGSIMTLAAIAMGQATGARSSFALPLIVCLLVGIAAGALNGLLIEVFHLDSMVATLATAEALLGIGTVWTNATEGKPGPAAWSNSLSAEWGGVSIILIIAILLVILFSLLIANTGIGRKLTAASVGPTVSKYQGLRVRRYRFGAYTVAGLLYGLAGALLIAIIQTPTTSMGNVYQFGTIVAVILGGASLTGGRLRPFATLAGAVFLIIVDQDIAVMGLTAGYQSITQGVIIMIAVLILSGTGSGLVNKWKLGYRRDTGNQATEDSVRHA